jgi:2-amino-4-hydroxy-6-hydroxymethyldihydropteridine diphosphokinase
MKFSDWDPEYRSILREFRFPPEKDREAALVLREELRATPQALSRTLALRELRQRVTGQEVILVGGGPLPPTLVGSAVPRSDRSVRWIAADGATKPCLDAGIVPDVIVSDLDGTLPEEVEASRRGALMLVHAHGDNILALREWVRRFPGPVVGTCACEPSGELLNPGGFTDGDRCVFLAEEFRAKSARLVGFDFDQPWGEAEATRETKMRKLLVARRLIDAVAKRGRVPLEYVDPGGARHPWVGPQGAAPG